VTKERKKDYYRKREEVIENDKRKKEK